MPLHSRYTIEKPLVTLRPMTAFALLLGLSALVGACMTYQPAEDEPATPGDGAFKFPHAVHLEQGMTCDVCHEPSEDGVTMAMPTHETCSICHDIPEDIPEDLSVCKFCHRTEDFDPIDRTKALSEELRFSHGPHLEASVECATCHTTPDERPGERPGMMQTCMACHGKTRPELNDCQVCHTEITADTPPTHRGTARIAHDAPEIWKRVHGREAQVDPKFCATCHDKESSCEECHRQNPPDDHTASWRRKTHGLQAGWNRDRCATCHEEDTCMRCHENTTPASHRGSWDGPVNRHCLSCHFPEERNECTVCHEEIEHRGALPSPHVLGIYPANCANCHPGGIPTRAPHLMNSTTRCVVCHR